MKYVVFLGDGMADTPVEALEGKTPLAVAKKANIDALAPHSEVGMAKTIPDGMKPGSDTANLAVMGYDPRSCYSGRSPLEALSMGLTLEETDIAVRCNLVTLSSDGKHYADKRMIDYSAGEISTEESSELIAFLQEKLGNERCSFHAGISYRHCLIVHDAKIGSELTPPHDITGKPIKRHLPSGELGDLFLDLQMKSYDLLKDHPINLKRVEEGKNPANSIWFWGEGTKPAIPDFHEKNGVKGAVISAVDLLKGIGKGAGMEVIEVAGATGNVHTDFAAKGRAAIDALGRVDYVYIHVEAPDESGHQGSLEDKITSIEKIDSDIVGPVLAYLKESGEPYHVLVCPDHPTPLATRTHSADPIPYLIYKSDDEKTDGPASYDEESAKASGIFVEEGFRLIERLFSTEPTPLPEGISPAMITSADGSEEILLGETKEQTEEAAPAEEQSAEGGKEAGAEGESAPSGEGAEKASEEKKPEDKEGEKEKKKKEKKEKKPSKVAAFIKKHLVLFIILIVSLLAVGGLIAGHFIATYHISLVYSEEGLLKTLEKEQITTVVLKKDITVSGDLIYTRSVDFDLNEYTLTVQGDFSLPLDEDVSIGYKKSGEYVFGGKIEAKNIKLAGAKSLLLYADLKADAIEITAASAGIIGNIEKEDTVTTLNVAEIAYQGKAEGTLALAENSVLTMNGDAKAIKNGKTVYLMSGTVESVTDTAELYLYEEGAISKIVNVGEYHRVTRLAAPDQVTVLEENGDFKCYVSEVIGATEFAYTLNGEAKPAVAVVKGKTTVITLNSDDLTPGEQTIVIKATAPNNKDFLESHEKTFTFEFTSKLGTPQPTVTAASEEGPVTLNIPAVKHADKYVYTVDGKEYETTETATDITDKVSAGGVHVIKVTAKSNNKYFADSNTAMESYIHYITLSAPTATVTVKSKNVTFTWDSLTGATSYLVRYGADKIYTTDLSLTFALLEDRDLTIQAIGGGFYKDSAVDTVTAATIAALIPAEEEKPEKEFTQGDESDEEEGDVTQGDEEGEETEFSQGDEGEEGTDSEEGEESDPFSQDTED